LWRADSSIKARDETGNRGVSKQEREALRLHFSRLRNVTGDADLCSILAHRPHSLATLIGLAQVDAMQRRRAREAAHALQDRPGNAAFVLIRAAKGTQKADPP
jgi:hypothetical protein